MANTNFTHRKATLCLTGANSRESSRNNPNARSDVTCTVKYYKVGDNIVYISDKVLVPSDRKQAGRNNDYVQQRFEVPPSGQANLSFARSKAPLWMTRSTCNKNGPQIKLEVHVQENESE